MFLFEIKIKLDCICQHVLRKNTVYVNVQELNQMCVIINVRKLQISRYFLQLKNNIRAFITAPSECTIVERPPIFFSSSIQTSALLFKITLHYIVCTVGELFM